MMRKQLDESDRIAPLVRRDSVARPTLVHGDLNTFNLLVDSASGRLTALPDFDLTHVASPADEFFYSFRTLGWLLVGPFETGDEPLLRKCLLRQFDKTTPPTCDGHGKVN
ncbi:hypothetical protein E0Z10_g1946 [Xylaria hypoxylon]|uniref:Aminoglycoside phosphotransferase domain-containing protein n=1 Tax=Xylaria hypoxylon TaxID=37992 RepID=A0A4Z0Z5P9_9PEZI|nr:hypothetical protein E0Z10_g1946 [Xylaria hypoxylon]